MKKEGAAFKPLPTVGPHAPEAEKVRLRLSREAHEPRCEICGHSVIMTQCRRICRHCGFMAGCAEAI